MQKHLEKMGEVTFEKIFNQKLGMPQFPFFSADVLARSRAGFKGGRGPGPQASHQQRPPTKPFIFYFWLLVIFISPQSGSREIIILYSTM